MAAAGVVLGVLAGCSQNPQFRMSLANHAYSSLGTLYILLGTAELGGFRTPSTFGEAADDYAAALGGFEMSRLLVAGRRLDAASDAGRALDDALDGCLDAIREMAARHRTAGLPPGTIGKSVVRARCDAAARLVAAQEVSSWIFSTAAGDI